MENEIKVGEYVKDKWGNIAKVIEVDENCITIDKNYFDWQYRFVRDMTFDERIVKHSFEKQELIEEGDILKYKVNKLSNWKIGEVKKYKDARSLKEYLGVKGFSLEQIEILKILTKELFDFYAYQGDEKNEKILSESSAKEIMQTINNLVRGLKQINNQMKRDRENGN